MKKLFLLLIVLSAPKIFAICTYEIQDRSGRSVDSFTSRSCALAHDQCKIGIVQRFRTPGLRCREVVRRPIPRPRPGNSSCEYSIVRNYGNGRIVDSFARSGRRACEKALSACERELEDEQDFGRYRRAICKKTSRSSHNNYVTKTCDVERRSIYRGYVYDTYEGEAYGRRGSGVKARACDDALEQCRDDWNYSSYNQECVIL